MAMPRSKDLAQAKAYMAIARLRAAFIGLEEAYEKAIPDLPRWDIGLISSRELIRNQKPDFEEMIRQIEKGRKK